MDDDRALEHYGEFRKNYRAQAVVERVVPVATLGDGNPIPLAIMPFIDLASDTLRELSNTINDFRRLINVLAAWLPIYNRCETKEKLELLLEHIRAPASLALSAPQAIKGRLVFASAMSSGHTNYELHRDDPELQWSGKGHLTMKIASRVGQPWASWKTLAPILNELGRGAIYAETDDYRNQREHGHPRNIGIGLTAMFTVEDTKEGRSWDFGTRPAIPLESVIGVSIEQHAAVCSAYDAYCELTKEQFTALIGR